MHPVELKKVLVKLDNRQPKNSWRKN